MPPRSAKVIGLYPPYHPYPPHLKDTDTFPKHADGGPDGQDVFKDQLRIADHHLAEGGSIIFNQMCVGRNGKPDFVEYIPTLVSDSSLTYYNIYEPIETHVFLKEVYGDKYTKWQEDFSQKNPQIFYCNGVITRDGNAGQVNVYDRSLDHRAEGTSWRDRFELHKKIAEHG